MKMGYSLAVFGLTIAARCLAQDAKIPCHFGCVDSPTIDAKRLALGAHL